MKEQRVLYAHRKSSFPFSLHAEERLLSDISAASSFLLCNEKPNINTSWKYFLFFRGIKVFLGFNSNQKCLRVSSEQKSIINETERRQI